MRHNAGGRRLRNRHNNNNGGGHNGGQRYNNNNRGGGGSSSGGYGNNRNQVFDSNGPEVRIRGTAFQISEKYQALAKDAFSADNRVLAESYLQHAEHYQRIINAWNEENPIRDQRVNNDSPDDQPVVESTVVTVTAVATEQTQGEDDLGLPASLVAPVRQLAEA